MSESEFATIKAKAKAQALTISAYLRMKGMDVETTNNLKQK